MRRPRIRPIYLVAPSGHPNWGDEKIAATWLQYLSIVHPLTPVILDCHTPGQASVLLRSYHQRLTCVDTLWRICDAATTGVEDQKFATSRETSPHEIAARCRKMITNPGEYPAIASGIALLLRSQSLHLLGGGYINDIWPHHVGIVAAMAEAGRLANIPVRATGQGIFPYEAIAETLATEFRAFTSIDVRDSVSQSFFVQQCPDIPLSSTGDDAWLGFSFGRVQPGKKGTQHARERETQVCIQADLLRIPGESGLQQTANFLKDTLDSWGVKGKDLSVIECIPGTDFAVWNLIAKDFPEAHFEPSIDLWREGLPVNPHQRWLSSRFHPHLFASAAGASGVALDIQADNYYAVKHQSLVDSGSRWTIHHNLETIPPSPSSGGFARSTVKELHSQ